MTPIEIELTEGESLLADGEEIIFRQVTQHMLDKDGNLGSVAFTPMTSDQGKPSFSRSSIVSAQEARDWHSRTARSRSLGVRALSVAEAGVAARAVVDDSSAPLGNGVVRAPGHCYVDFRGLDKAGRKAVAAILLRFALQRGEIPTTETPDDGQQQFQLDAA